MFTILISFLFIHFADASSINLFLPFSDDCIGQAKQKLVPADGTCFFHAADVTRSAFKEIILAIKNGTFHTENADLRYYADRHNETSPIFNGNTWAEYESNTVVPAEHFTDAEALAYAFDIHIEVYERGEEDISRANLSAIYNPAGRIKKKLLMGYNTGEDLAIMRMLVHEVQIPAHFDKLFDITYLDTGWAKAQLTKERVKELEHMECVLWSADDEIAQQALGNSIKAEIKKREAVEKVYAMMNAIMQTVEARIEGRSDEHAIWLRAHTKNEIEIMKSALKLPYNVTDSSKLATIEWIVSGEHDNLATQSLTEEQKATLKSDTIKHVNQEFDQILSNVEQSVLGRNDEHAEWLKMHAAAEVKVLQDVFLKRNYPSVYT